jgi:hypothetical protein
MIDRAPRSASTVPAPAAASTTAAPARAPSSPAAAKPKDAFEVGAAAPVRNPLPPDVARAKRAVLEISARNTRSEDLAGVRAELMPHLDVLRKHFAANRPANEAQLTQGTWKSLWYDDPDIERGPKFLPLDRDRIYQVVKSDHYYNVSESTPTVLGLKLGRIQSFLRGNYRLENRPTAENRGEEKLNVIALEFAGNRARLGRLPTDVPLERLVEQVDSGAKLSIPVPGPRGIRGELYNLYVDADLRVSAGVQLGDSKSTDLDLYILRRATTVSD